MPKLYIREFLNLPEEGTAFVLAEAGDRRGPLEASLTLCDCHRQITIDLSVYGPSCVANVRHKSALLRKAVNELLNIVDARLDAVHDQPPRLESDDEPELIRLRHRMVP